MYSTPTSSAKSSQEVSQYMKTSINHRTSVKVWLGTENKKKDHAWFDNFIQRSPPAPAPAERNRNLNHLNEGSVA